MCRLDGILQFIFHFYLLFTLCHVILFSLLFFFEAHQQFLWANFNDQRDVQRFGINKHSNSAVIVCCSLKYTHAKFTIDIRQIPRDKMTTTTRWIQHKKYMQQKYCLTYIHHLWLAGRFPWAIIIIYYVEFS